jgi:hypothetical protein
VTFCLFGRQATPVARNKNRSVLEHFEFRRNIGSWDFFANPQFVVPASAGFDTFVDF